MIKLFGKSFAPSNNQKGLEPQQCSFDEGISMKHCTSTTSCELNEKSSQALEEDVKSGKRVPIEGETSTSQSGTTHSSEEHNTLKKPDKIIPCPRCTSMDTKFCYYNNYNVNQPRHFCRKCQRYWTAGGLMRSVPVGSGRRKNNKHTHAPQNLVSNFLEESTRSNGVYGFGSNMIPFSESTSQSCLVSDQFSYSDQMGSNANAMLGSSNHHGFPIQAPFYSMQHWPTVWPCNISGAWPTPDSLNQSFMSSSASSQTMGKHSRDEANISNNAVPCKDDALRSGNRLKGGVWVPKTLRFDAPNDASKGSIWATSLGINSENASYINSRGLSKDLQSKKDVEESSHRANTSPMLQVNPAAMSRSQNFRETM